MIDLRRSSGFPMPDIVPLMDVVFLLLVFFILAVLRMSVQSDLDIHLPAASAATHPAADALTISLTSEDAVTVDHTSIQPDQLVAYIRNLPGDAPDRPIRIQADRKSSTGMAVTLIDRLKTAGYDRVMVAVAAP